MIPRGPPRSLRAAEALAAADAGVVGDVTGLHLRRELPRLPTLQKSP